MTAKTVFKQTDAGMIPEDWEVLELQQISKVIDSLHVTPNYSPDGFPMVRATDIKSGNLDLERTLRVTKEVYEEFTRNHKPRRNDILMSRVGTYFVTSFVETDEPFCIGQNTVVICPSINSRFVYYSLHSKFVTRQIQEELVGSGGQKTLSLEDIRELLIQKPTDRGEIEGIARILSDLDSKIELNNQMNKTLEAIGQAIFKHWFIDFEFPNEEGEPHKSNGGEMIDSELGDMPEGWKVEKLDKFVEFIKGKKPRDVSRIFVEGYKPQILIETLDSGTFDYCNPEGIINVSKLEPIMVMDGASSGRVEIGYEGILGSTLSKIISTTDSLSNLYIYYFLRSNERDINENTTGTSIPHADKQRIRNYLFVLPDKRIIQEFDNIVSAIVYRIIANKNEISTTSRIRDLLLPKLMSGRIRVPVEAS